MYAVQQEEGEARRSEITTFICNIWMDLNWIYAVDALYCSA